MGKTVQSLHERVNAHRSSFYKFLSTDCVDDIELDDSNILGHHLFVCHNSKLRSDFNSNFKFDVISFANPSNIRVIEQFYIDKLKTRIPFGLNQIDSVF